MERPIPKPRKSLMNKSQPPIDQSPPVPPRDFSRRPPPRPPPPAPPSYLGFEKLSLLSLEEELKDEIAIDNTSLRSSKTSNTPTSLRSENGFNNYEALHTDSLIISRPGEKVHGLYIEPLVYPEKSDGESICFAGWASIINSKKEKDRFWAVLRQKQLLLMENDEVSAILMIRVIVLDGNYLSPFDGSFEAHLCWIVCRGWEKFEPGLQGIDEQDPHTCTIPRG